MTPNTHKSAVHYDPYDVDIDNDPYPTWSRLRDESPLYRNDELDFYALSRWDDVKPALLDWQNYRSGRGTVLEIVKAGVEIPPGILLFEDPPIHDAHRALLSRVFTPRRMLDLEPLVRSYCVARARRAARARRVRHRRRVRCRDPAADHWLPVRDTRGGSGRVPQDH